MRKYSLGVDIGIASVGWGLIDEETGSVIDHGVRLFEEAGLRDFSTAERRKFRSTRRVKRRRSHRLERLRDIFMGEGWMGAEISRKNNPYEIRVRALREKVPREDLAIALLHIAKRRGFGDNVMVEEGDEKAKKELSDTKQTLSDNDKLLLDKEICEVQLDRLQKEGCLRGVQNRFRTRHYIREAKKILKTQEVEDSLAEKILEIIRGRRVYSDGPGNDHSPTPYGSFVYDKNGNPETNEDGSYKRIEMIEKMRGKCSVYRDKPRAPRSSYTAFLFNLLNDLNNLSCEGKKISKEQKKEMVKFCLEERKDPTETRIAKITKWEKEKMSGYRRNKSEKTLLSSLEGWNKLWKKIAPKEWKYLSDHTEKIDDIAEILTKEKDVERRKCHIIELTGENLSPETVLLLAESDLFTKYHALSFEAMREMIPDLWETNKNHMQLLSEGGFLARGREKAGQFDIPFDDEAILSPVAKRSHREAIKVINAVRRKYGEPTAVVVEMPRDKNSAEQKKFIKEMQKRNEEGRKIRQDEAGGKKLSENQFLALLLYKQQDGKSLYSGKEMHIDTIVNDSHSFQIDHIIPRSVSFDDSMENKVLCFPEENSNKGNCTPFQWFASGNAPGSWEDFVARVSISKNISRKKKEKLFFSEDISKYDVQKKFINRNLVDTRYASRTFLNTLQRHFRGRDVPVSVQTIRGNITALFRKKAEINKDRDKDYSHHAADALLVAGMKRHKLFDKAFHIAVKEEGDSMLRFDGKTGEVITDENEKLFFDSGFCEFVKEVRKVSETTKYSHKVDRKPNRGIANQTLYGIREYDGEEFLIVKYSGIYDRSAGNQKSDGEKLAERIRKGGKGILMRENDPETYAFLRKVVDEYPKEKNPFAKYYEDHGEYIRKKSKSGKGPIVKSIRYKDAKQPYIDISKNYQNGNGGKVVLCSMKTFRLDFYRNKKGVYEFLKLPHYLVRRRKGSEGYMWEVDPKGYEAVRKERINQKRLSEDADFLFSLSRGDVFGCVRNGIEIVSIFMGTKDADVTIYAHDPSGKVRSRPEKEPGITKSITEMKKYSTDILGNRYNVKLPEKLVLRWK